MKKILPLALAGLLSTTGFTAAHARDGLYFSAEGGIAAQNGLPTKEDVQATDVKTSYAPNAIRLGAGYNHDFFKFFGFGLETGIAQYAKTTYTYANRAKAEVSARTLEFLAVGTFHVHPNADLLAKIGGVRLTPNVTGPNAPDKSTKIATEVAAGALYHLSNNLDLSLTYAHVFGTQLHHMEELKIAAPSLNEVMFGIRYTFGQV